MANLDRIKLTKIDEGHPKEVYIIVDQITWIESHVSIDDCIVHCTCGASIFVEETVEKVNAMIDSVAAERRRKENEWRNLSRNK